MVLMIGAKTRYILKVSTTFVAKGYHVNRLESIIYGMQMCILQTRT